MFNRATPLKPAAFLALPLLFAFVSAANAQSWRSPTQVTAGHQPAAQMRKVPTAAVSPSTQTPTQNPRAAGWDLNWRPSTKIQRVPKSSTDVFADAPVQRASQTTTDSAQQNPVRVAAWNQEEKKSENNFFDNPFGKVAQVDAQQAPTFQDTPPPVAPAQESGLPQNQLRNAGPSEGFSFPPGDVGNVENLPAPLRGSGLEAPKVTPNIDPNTAPSAVPDTAPRTVPEVVPNAETPNKLDALRDMLENEAPPVPNRDSMDQPSIPEIEEDSPSDVEEFGNPFPNRDLDEEDVRRLNDRTKQQRERTKDSGFNVDASDDMRKVSAGISCEDFRERIAQQSIRTVSLDISPPYRPDVLNENEFQKVKQEFDEKQPFRDWRSIDGRVLSSGRLRDLAYEKVVIETEQGSLSEVPINRLSEADIAYISENWQLPQECLLAQIPYKPRNWAPMTMTWKASNLCHKPLYFEDVNLERYGHTRGPLLEPVVQSAHFFANIAILPYKMGVHAPNECQYALGYYRPGSCAPWIKDPFPLSARGAIAQGAAMTGLFWLVP